MTTLNEIEDFAKREFDRLIFAVKVNTAITGVGLAGLGLSMLVTAYVISIYHETEMRALNGINQHNTVNVERIPNQEELRADAIKKEMARLQTKDK